MAKGQIKDGIGVWSDSPVEISKTYPYCWVVSRKVSGSNFGE
jgi:hypothetical protein